MEYPGSKITKPIRNAILITAVAIFFLLAPVLISYTSGYRYDWRRGFLRETGALNIDVEPKNASVAINDVKIKSNMPVRLADRIPGKYKILISAPGYFNWQKEIEIKNKQTFYIKEISILKSNQPELITEGKIENIKISFDGKFIVYLKSAEKNIEAHAISLDTLSDMTLAFLPLANGAKIEMSPISRYLVVSDDATPHKTLVIFNLDDVAKKIDLISRTGYPINKYQWKEAGETELYYSTDLRLMSIIPSTEQRYSLAKNDWKDWHMENGQLWTVQIASTTNKIKLVKDTLGFSEDFTADTFFSPTEQKLSLLTAKDNHLLLKKDEMPEMIIIAKDKKYNIAGDKFKISPYNNWWLIWTPWEIWTYSAGEEPNLLNRSGEGLKEIEPLDRYNTLALIWNDKATALYPYYLVSHNLVNATITSAVSDTESKILYFTASIDGREGLWKLAY